MPVTARPKLAEPIAYDSAARAELAVAIAERRTAEAAVTTLKQAVEQLRGDGVRLASEAWAAEESLTGTPALQAAFLLARAKGEAVDPPLTVAQAQEALQRAAEARRANRTALDAAETALRTAEQSASWVADKVRTRAAAVVAASPEVAKLLGDVERLQRDLVERGAALALLASMGAVATKPPGSMEAVSASVERQTAIVRRMDTSPQAWRRWEPREDCRRPWDIQATETASQAAWRDTLATLEHDANADLPA